MFKKYGNDDCILYYGSRFGYKYCLDDYRPNKYTSKGFFVSPSIGGEYYLIDRFSLGVELQTEFSHINRFEMTSSTENGYVVNGFTTNAYFFMRFYIF